MPDFQKPYDLTSDPHFAQGLNSLAKMFAPPSPHEVLYGAKAQETQQKIKMLSDLYSLAQDPNFDQSRFDRMGAAAGQWTPNQSYYSVDQSNATSRANNTADNETRLRQTGMQQAGELQRAMVAPVAQGATRFNPPTIAQMFGVPEMQVGAVNAGQGDTVTLPDGRVIKGAAKPLSETELKAQILAGLPQGEQRAVAIGNTPVRDVVGPDGKPVIKFQADSVGQQPFVKPADVGNYIGPNGEKGMFRVGADGLPVDAMTGKPIPAGSTELKQQSTGTPDQFGKPTEFTDKNAMFYLRSANADASMRGLMGKGYVPGASDFELTMGAGDNLPVSIANNLVSPEGQQFYRNAKDFMMSILRPDTGAAFGKDEFRSYGQVFIPFPGDSPQVLKDKEAAREIALVALQGGSRGAADRLVGLMAQNGLPVPPELQRRLAASVAAGGAQPAAPGAAPLDQQLRGEKGAPSPAPQAPKPPAVGEVKGGYRFKGGDPALPASWEAVQ